MSEWIDMLNAFIDCHRGQSVTLRLLDAEGRAQRIEASLLLGGCEVSERSVTVHAGDPHGRRVSLTMLEPIHATPQDRSFSLQARDGSSLRIELVD
jgi:hypothetical protein